MVILKLYMSNDHNLFVTEELQQIIYICYFYKYNPKKEKKIKFESMSKTQNHINVNI